MHSMGHIKGCTEDMTQFPITALREIKLLKMLSHVNILRLEEMAVERNKGCPAKVLLRLRPVVNLVE